MLGLLLKVIVTAIALLSTICSTSAFSTHFITEETKEDGKKEEQENDKIKEQSMLKSVNNENKLPQAIEVKVIPLVTDIFTQAEDMVNMTPLKLATAISAQYLITSIQNIPIAGDSALDVFNMLQGLMNDINKTTEIIKLTAEFVNVSSSYILSSLDQFIKSGCDPMIVSHEMDIIRQKFLKMITDHVQLAVKELNDKNILHDMSASDILVSSARHIVGAFQEMTNEISLFASTQNEKCNSSPMKNISSSINQDYDNKNNVVDEIVSKFDPPIKNHQSIKKDSVIINIENVEKPIANAHMIGDQDLTIEVSPLEIHSQGKSMINQEVKKDTLIVPEVTTLEQYPYTLLIGNRKEKNNNQLKSSGFDQAHSFIVSNSNIDQAELENTDTVVPPKDNTESSNKLFNVVEFLTNRGLGGQKPPNMPCDENVEPVCGIDVNINRFIIFLNDCKRKSYNSVHGTNYAWFNMDTCVENLLKNQNQIAEQAQNTN